MLHASRALRKPPALLAGLVSMLAPGAGQLWLGHRVRGLLMLCLFVLLAAAASAALLLEPVEILRLVVRPRVLLGLLAANAVLCVFRVYCAVDAYGLAARRQHHPRMLPAAVSLAGLVLLTSVPHVAAGYYDYRSYRVLDTVFADSEPADVLTFYPEGSALFSAKRAAASGPVLPKRIRKQRSRPARARWLLDPAGSGSRALFLNTPGPKAVRRADGWFTAVLLGGDAGPNRWGLRTDTMIVIAVQARTGRALALSVPRNLRLVPLAGKAAGEYGRFADLLNALYAFAHAHPDLFPGGRDPGATALKQTLSGLLGLRIQYYALVDLRSFAGIVDALGGVTIRPTEQVQDLVSPVDEDENWIPIDVHAGGTYHFDGRTALAYARSRWATSDYRRMARQRCILSATAAQLDVVRILRGFPKLASAIERYVRTDIPLRRVPDLVELVHSVKPRLSLSVTLGPPIYAAGGSDYPDLPKIRAAVRQMLLAPGQARRTYGVQTARETC